MKNTLAITLLVLSACDGSAPLDGGSDGGMDAAQPDGGPAPVDAGPPWTGPGCSETVGIECDGDWAGRCATACDSDECCSPQEGRFRCVPRGVDGSCPAANIWVDEDRIAGAAGDQYAVEWRYFAEDDCAIAEGCVTASGWRRLLVFGTWTPNTGEADLFLGVPEEAPPFMYSSCHDHFHFNGYAEYELRASDGTVAAEGHKQAFCLLDFYQYPGTDDTGWHYTCDNQGIQRGWQDVYDASLDCQWVDVTDVAPGDYTLRIDLNVDHALLESNYDDNRADVTVSIPADAPTDPTAACPFDRTGQYRDCGWTRQTKVEPYGCTAGETVRVGCSTSCSLGACTGDTVMRVCDPDADGNCGGRTVIASNDESGCADGDSCSEVSFTCPASGAFVAYWAPYDSTATDASCTIAVAP